jgi:exonuclease III
MITIMGDFNARVGNKKIHNNIGHQGENTCNRNGKKKLIDFVVFNNMKIMNTFFQHKNSHKCTWAARGQTSIIDYIVCNAKLSDMVLDTRVYRGPEIESDHHLVISPIRIPPRWTQKCQTNEFT